MLYPNKLNIILVKKVIFRAMLFEQLKLTNFWDNSVFLLLLQQKEEKESKNIN
jgi:hypothetical protein